MSSINGSSETSPFHSPYTGARTSGNGGVPRPVAAEGANPPPVGPAPRTMADITRLFMTGASSTPPNRPQRLSPQLRASGATLPVNAGVGSHGATEASGNVPVANEPKGEAPMAQAPTLNMPSLPEVMVQNVLCTLTGNAAVETYHRLAQRLAAQLKGAVGLIYVRDQALCIERVEGKTPARFIPTQFPNTQTLADVHLARILFTLQKNVEHWLIVPPSMESVHGGGKALGALRKQLLSSAPSSLLLTSIGRDDILLAYRLLKELSSALPEPEGQIQVVIDGPEEQVKPVVERLISTSRDFLGLTLNRLELPTAMGMAVENIVRVEMGPLAADTRNSLWMAVGDMVTELTGPAEIDEEALELDLELSAETETAQEQTPKQMPGETTMADVLDADERAALAADLPEMPNLAEEAPEAVAAKPEEEEPVTAIPVTHAPIQMPRAQGAVPKTPAPIAPADLLKAPVHMTVPAAEKPGLKQPLPSATTLAQPAVTPLDILHAVDCPIMPSSNPELWPLVRSALVGMQHQMKHTALAAPLAFGQGMLTADSEKNLHLWLLIDRQDPIGWSLVANWAKQNSKLIALTQPNAVAVENEPQLNLHLIIPPVSAQGAENVVGMNQAIQLGHMPHLRYYRVMPVLWNARTGLVVIPQG